VYRLKQLTLLSGDLVCLCFGLFVALIVRQGHMNSLLDVISPMMLLFFLAAIIMFISGLYDVTRLKNEMEMYGKLTLAASIWILAGIVFFYLNIKAAASPRTILALTGLVGFLFVAIWRTIYNRLLSTSIWKATIAFAGITPETKELIEFLTNRPQLGYKITGVFSPNTENLPADISQYKNPEELPFFDIIVVAPTLESEPTLTKNLYKNLFRRAQIETLAEFYEKIIKRVPPFTLSETWFLSNLQEQNKKIYDRAKLILDYFAAVLMSIFFVLTFPIIALLIKLGSPGPIFYSQNRVGRDGKIFRIHKYRTMKAAGIDGSAETNGPQYAQQKDDRITVFGKFLRLARLDELPQLINIFKGEMTLIGPRPERPEFVNTLTQAMPFYAIRHLVKPGLTGWAQLQNNYYGTVDENLRKLEYDLYYIKNRGPILDLIIILRTVNIVLGLKGR
jgi:exopolysaccharide biosynthesis polyprenyl glycosylphosphotransferase